MPKQNLTPLQHDLWKFYISLVGTASPPLLNSFLIRFVLCFFFSGAYWRFPLEFVCESRARFFLWVPVFLVYLVVDYVLSIFYFVYWLFSSDVCPVLLKHAFMTAALQPIFIWTTQVDHTSVAKASKGFFFFCYCHGGLLFRGKLTISKHNQSISCSLYTVSRTVFCI